MLAGRLRQQIEIIETARGGDGSGGTSSSVPISVVKVWAEEEQLSMTESTRAGQIESRRIRQFKIRYARSHATQIKPTQDVYLPLEDVTLRIQKVLTKGRGTKIHLVIEAEELRAGGQ